MSTLGSIYNNSKWSLAFHSKSLLHLQEQVATGSRINRTSDDPTNSNKLLKLYSEEKSVQNHIDTISNLQSRLSLSSSIVENMTSELSKLRERMTSVMSGVNAGTQADSTRKMVAEEFDSSLEQLVSLANSQQAGYYLFGGADSSIPPYQTEKNSEGEIVRVTYAGSYNERAVIVASGVEAPSAIVGESLFRSDNRGVPEFLGETGAVPGSGTSNLRGSAWLEVREPTPGNFEISIDGTNFQAIPAGGEANTRVVNPDTGEFLFVDTTAITAPGLEAVTVSGTYDIFNTLTSIRDLLRNENGLSEEDWMGQMEKLADDIKEVEKKLSNAFTLIGGRNGSLDTLKDALSEQDLQVQEERSRIEDADIAQLSIDLAEREVLYQMTMQVTSKLFNLSILDYI